MLGKIYFRERSDYNEGKWSLNGLEHVKSTATIHCQAEIILSPPGC
jgi:hypothetical protein